MDKTEFLNEMKIFTIALKLIDKMIQSTVEISNQQFQSFKRLD